MLFTIVSTFTPEWGIQFSRWGWCISRVKVLKTSSFKSYTLWSITQLKPIHTVNHYFFHLYLNNCQRLLFEMYLVNMSNMRGRLISAVLSQIFKMEKSNICCIKIFFHYAWLSSIFTTQTSVLFNIVKIFLYNLFIEKSDSKSFFLACLILVLFLIASFCHKRIFQFCIQDMRKNSYQ